MLACRVLKKELMQLIGFLIWLGLIFLLATIVNAIAKRPLMNPWIWFAGSYALCFILGIVIGVSRNVPHLAYNIGYYLPVAAVAVGLGLWRGPKWREARLAAPSASEAAGS